MGGLSYRHTHSFKDTILMIGVIFLRSTSPPGRILDLPSTLYTENSRSNSLISPPISPQALVNLWISKAKTMPFVYLYNYRRFMIVKPWDEENKYTIFPFFSTGCHTGSHDFLRAGKMMILSKPCPRSARIDPISGIRPDRAERSLTDHSHISVSAPIIVCVLHRKGVLKRQETGDGRCRNIPDVGIAIMGW
jgi:hypothetical protein